MGTLKRSIDMMMEGALRLNESIKYKTQSENEQKSLVPQDLDSLSAFELLYYICREENNAIIGTPDTVFATFDSRRKKITVYAKQEESVEILPYRTLCMTAALNCAQERKASFAVHGSKVTCTIDETSSEGSSYEEAALRALVKHHQQNKT